MSTVITPVFALEMNGWSYSTILYRAVCCTVQQVGGANEIQVSSSVTVAPKKKWWNQQRGENAVILVITYMPQ